MGTLNEVAEALRAAGFEVELREPDGQDPLGGVVDVRGPFGLVRIVNYGGRFPAVIDGGLAAADIVIRPSSRLRIVPIPHLIALKLYAGGTKSRADIVELLSRNPDADLAAIRDLCHGWRLRGLEPLIEEAMGKQNEYRHRRGEKGAGHQNGAIWQLLQATRLPTILRWKGTRQNPA